MPIGNAISAGTPAKTANRPITTEDSTMMVPTERSMPAVRMISVCGDAENADDRHLREDGRQVGARGEARRLTSAEQHAEQQHDEGHDGRIGVQETLQSLQDGERSSKAATCRRGAGQHPLELGARAGLSLRSWLPRRYRSPLVLWIR